MNTVKNLGELVRRDRERRGLTQAALALQLSKLGRSAHYRKANLSRQSSALRAWLAKLETGKLRRDIGESARKLLAVALATDPVVYQSLPVKPEYENSVSTDFDVLPLVKHLAQADRTKFTFGEFCNLCEASQRCSEIGVSLIDPLATTSDPRQ